MNTLEEEMDLGVRGLAAVKAHLDKTKGAPVPLGPLVVEDDYAKTWGNETHEQLERKGAQVARARELAINPFVIVRPVLGNLAKMVVGVRLVQLALMQGLGMGPARARAAGIALVAMWFHHLWGAKARIPENRLVSTSGPGELPFFGGLLTMAWYKDIAHNFITNMIREKGFSTIEVQVPTASFVLVMDARDREYILKTNFRNYLKNHDDDLGSMEFVFGEIMGRGIFSTDKVEWLDSRKTASHMFSGKNLQKQMEQVFNAHADHVVELLEKHFVVGGGGVVDIQEVFQSAVFDAFCEIAFGIFPNAIASAVAGRKPEFLIAFDQCQIKAAERMLDAPVIWHVKRLFAKFTGLTDEAEYMRNLKIVDDYVYPIIEARMRDANVVDKNDLLSLYIKHGRDTNQPHMLTPEYLRDTIVNFMIAGRDTTSCTLTNTVRFIADSPEASAKLLETLRPFRDKSQVTWDDSKTVPFADAVFNEVLRMAPPVGDDFRICCSDDVWPSGMRVRDGARCFVPNIAIGRDPLLWKQPDEFNPDRWMRYVDGVAQPVRRVDEYVLPVFFAGRRLCLGKDMARFEAIVFMAKLFNKFRITPTHPVALDPPYVMGPVIFLKGGLPCRIERA